MRTCPIVPRRLLLVTIVPLLALTACAGQASPAGSPKTTAAPPGSTAPPRSTTSPSPTTSATSPSRSRRPGGPVTVAFAGDIHFEGVDAARLARDPRTAIGPIAPALRAADLAMVNLETAITTGGTRAPKKYTFRAPPAAFTALASAGVDVATVANNHGMDFGASGLSDTLAAARAAGFPLVGAGRDEAAAFAPYRTTIHGERIAIVGATQVIDSDLVGAWSAGPHKPGLADAKDLGRTVRAVRAAERRADAVIVYLHYGHELTQCPTEAQRRIVGALVAAGASAVIGTHAHVLLGGGWKRSAYVDYGLGNFVWYSAHTPQTAASGVLTLTLRGPHVTAAHWTPATISGGVPVPLHGSRARRALAAWNGLRSCAHLSAAAHANSHGK
jgi:poly-gamma-glutamate synthesis protein (capsule biosynthesis protein)